MYEEVLMENFIVQKRVKCNLEAILSKVWDISQETIKLKK